MDHNSDLVVFSHLRWDFVWQRPQHLMTRLANHRRVFFIEEPIPVDGGPPSWELRTPEKGLVVCRPRTPIASPGFHNDQLPTLRSLLDQLLVDQKIEDYLAWFYTPMALPLIDRLQPRGVIYDCMDELSAFRNAPAEMLDREASLLRQADLVFTGGPSLYRAKKDRHPRVHCFSSSVDASHFGSARETLDQPEGQANLTGPRLGFFGVIDERLDIQLLNAAAEARPDWQFLLVGPVVKIAESDLPRRPNIHYFGQRSYQDLPAFLSGWDVCLLPFARNEATRFISPTKTLEYMAAEKPIVSTPIADVAEPYGDIVHLAETPEQFIAACERALNETEAERAERVAKMRGVLARTSWERTASAMHNLMTDLVNQQEEARMQAEGSSDDGVSLVSETPVVVIGAGPTGLSAAYHLGEDALLLERNDSVGGWCRSIQENGFTFDFAGHIMFSNDKYVHEMYDMLLGDNVHWQDREAWVFSKNVYTRYPFQGALYGLPADVIKECILGAVEARYGTPAKSCETEAPSRRKLALGENGNGHANGNGNGHARSNGNGNGRANGKTNLQLNRDSWTKPGSVEDCCADGVMESTAPLGAAKKAPANFEEFIYQVWGAGIAKHFAIPYNRKLWAVPLSEMETSWLGGRVPMPDLGEMIDGALKPVPKPMGPNARFGYPLRGGFQALMDGFLPRLQGPLRLNADVAAISPARHEITLRDGERISYQQMISTMPLPTLIRIMGDEAPEDVRRAAASLRHISVRCVHLGVGRPGLTEKHWIYYPEDTVFHRIFVQGNASPHCNPAGGFGLTCEITYCHKNKPLPCDGDDLIRLCIEDCKRVGIIAPDDPIWAATQVDMPHAYVVYDHDRARNVSVVRDWLAEQDIMLAGRYSEWEYYNSDHAFLAGKKAAEKVRQQLNAGLVQA